MRRRIVPLFVASLVVALASPRADALFGVGDVVIDPTNLVQNILTAANTLKQINNQIAQLQNEAQMLVNQAEDLKNLDYTSTEHLRRVLERIETLMRRADEITYEVEQSERAYAERFPESYGDLTRDEIVQTAIVQWDVSRSAFSDAIIVQSAIVTGIVESRDTLTDLVGASQGATGNLAAVQAGNQLTALSVEQQMQMQQLMAAQYRAEALEAARRAAIDEQSREFHRRFMGTRSAYSRD
jgi:type IV secretion system protein TrbJ